MTDRFLQREVKQDGKGIYVHYGSSRLRPFKRKSRFKEGQLVSMIKENEWTISFAIFDNLEEYEIWKPKK